MYYTKGDEMKLFKLSQIENNGYDTYDSVIVCAKDKEEAQRSCICGHHKLKKGKLFFQYSSGKETEESRCSGWADYRNVKVEYIGEAKKGLKKGVVLSSFNAG